MPEIDVIFYQETDGTVPVRDWLAELRQKQPRAFAKCRVRIGRLAEIGYEIRRPESDFLRDGIHELRTRLGTVNYRISTRLRADCGGAGPCADKRSRCSCR